MKLTTIWTIPAMALRERLRRTWDEWFLLGLAARLPKRLSYWSLIASGAHASAELPDTEVPALRFIDVVRVHPGGGHD